MNNYHALFLFSSSTLGSLCLLHLLVAVVFFSMISLIYFVSIFRLFVSVILYLSFPLQRSLMFLLLSWSSTTHLIVAIILIFFCSDLKFRDQNVFSSNFFLEVLETIFVYYYQLLCFFHSAVIVFLVIIYHKTISVL